MATSDAPGMGLGLQILCAACANILTSSLMAVFNAWIFRQGYHFQFSLIVVQQAVCSLFAYLQVTLLPGEKEKVRISTSNYFRMRSPSPRVLPLSCTSRTKRSNTSPRRSTP